MKIMIVAGEVSGDLHGAGLIQSLNRENEKNDFFGIGGAKMMRENFRPYFSVDDLQSHGLIELIRHLPRLYKILIKMCTIMKNEKPSILILIDYPGFNLKLAACAKKMGIKVIFFNSPQIWAWRKRRINTIKRVVDKMIVLYPFEEKIYKEAQIDVSYVGHPLIDQKLSKKELSFFLKQFKIKSNKKIFVIAPGSRPSELRRHLPTILNAIPYIIKEVGDIKFVLPLAQSLNLTEVENMIQLCPVPITIIRGHFFESILSCDAAIVASGTASLQAGLALKPFIIVYKVSPITFWIAQNLSNTKYIGMVNILAKKEIVPELLQNEFNVRNITSKSIMILQDKDYRVKMIEELKKIKKQLGEPGAYTRSAGSIIRFLERHI